MLWDVLFLSQSEAIKISDIPNEIKRSEFLEYASNDSIHFKIIGLSYWLTKLNIKDVLSIPNLIFLPFAAQFPFMYPPKILLFSLNITLKVSLLPSQHAWNLEAEKPLVEPL